MNQSATGLSKEEESLYVAKKAYEDGFYEVALNLFRRFLRNFPHSQKIPEANLYIAQCYFQQNKFITALAQLEKLSSDPRAKDLKDAVLYWIAEVHFRGNDFRKALSFYERIIEEFPQSDLLAHAYYSRGWCLFELEEYQRAIDAFNNIIDKFPKQPLAQDAQFKSLECLYNLKNYEKLKEEIAVFQKRYPHADAYTGSIHFLLAECNFYLDDYEQAIRQYKIALDSSPGQKIFSLSQLGLAWSYLNLKNYLDAQELLGVINPDNLSSEEKEALFLAKANLFTEIGNFKEAKQVWSELQDIATNPTTKIQAYLGEAETLYNLEQYPQSIDVYQEAKDVSEDLPSQILDKLHYGLAWAFLKNGQFKEAIGEFQKAASFASDEIIRVAAMCQVGDTYQDAEDYEMAIQVYDQILGDYPDSFYVDYVQYQLGIACLRSSRYDEAILAFRTLLLNFPNSKLKTKAVYSLALGLFQKQDYQGCGEALQKYMPELKDEDLRVEAMYLLATSLYNSGKYSEAMGIFKQVIRGTEDIKIIQKAEYEIADCLFQMGKEKEALQRFKSLRSKYPDSTLSPEVTWWLGGYYFRKGNLELSRRYFSTLIMDFPRSGLVADGYYALGLLDQEEDELDSAIENLNKAIKFGSRDLVVQASIAIANILVQKDRLDEAETIYKEAIKKSPSLAGTIYPKISLIYEKKSDFDNAIIFYHKALSLVSMKEASGLQFKIARAYEQKGAYQQAIEEYLKIPYMYPADSRLIVKAYLSGAQIYENQNDFLKAKDIYLKIASMDVEEAKYAKERLDWIDNQRQGKER
jgi:tetratricopeptide (TPR) repeat protein